MKEKGIDAEKLLYNKEATQKNWDVMIIGRTDFKYSPYGIKTDKKKIIGNKKEREGRGEKNKGKSQNQKCN